MAEVDTSSYPKALPAQPPLQTLKDVQSLESGALSIDRQKLENANQALGYMTRAIVALGPNASKEQYIQAGQQAVKLGLAPPSSLGVWVDKIKNARTTADFYNEFLSVAANHQQLMETHLGQPGMLGTGQTQIPVRTPLGVGGGAPVQTGLPIQNQLPPGTEVPTPQGTQRLGAQPYEPPPAPSLPVGPVTGPIKGPSNNFGGTVVGAERLPSTPMVPRGPMSSQPPMFEAGKAQLAQDQELATKKLTAIKPALQALPLMKDLISSGPGTAALTTALAGLSNAGLISKGLTDKVAAQQEVIKKLYQYVSSNPVGQRSDAAQTLAEAGSPTPKVQILPALIKLTKDSIILDRVQAAMPNAFEDQDLSKYGKHRSMFPAQIDERAFGIDLMEPKERSDLILKMMKEKDTYEGKKFWKSLNTIDKLGLINTSI